MYKMFSQLFLLVFFFVTSTLALAKEDGNAWQSLFPSVPVITQDEIESNESELVFVDVRAKFLFDQAHKETAQNIPFSSRMFMTAMANLIGKNLGKTIVIYCESNNCIKSYRAVAKCVQADWNNVVIFDRNEELAKRGKFLFTRN